MTEKNLPFSGVECNHRTGICKVWWMATIKDKPITVEVRIPDYAKALRIPNPRSAELYLDDILNDSSAIL